MMLDFKSGIRTRVEKTGTSLDRLVLREHFVRQLQEPVDFTPADSPDKPLTQPNPQE
ncbi:hypothetical protein [Streptomyces sp. NPDC002758]